MEKAEAMSSPIRILHVDDEPADLEIARILIKREVRDDFDIVGVRSAKEALETLESGQFDIVIADYWMPGTDGIELLASLKKSEKYAHLPFIMFTGKGGPEVAKESFEKGADRYIAKGGDSAAKQCHELVKAVKELVRGEGEEE